MYLPGPRLAWRVRLLWPTMAQQDRSERAGGGEGAARADVAALIEFLRARVIQDRVVLGDHLSMIGPQYQLGTMQQSTVLVGPGRMAAHLDAVEQTIDRYEAAVSWVDLAKEQGLDTDVHRAAAVAYLDTLRLHAAEWATHSGYMESWRR
jgi:hypothetical protein